MSDDETEHAEQELDRGPDEAEPWAKTSSGDDDHVTDDDA